MDNDKSYILHILSRYWNTTKNNYRQVKLPKKMKYDETNNIYYQQVNWSKVKLNNLSDMMILKGDIACHKNYLLLYLANHIITDLSQIVIDYLFVEFNIKLWAEIGNSEHSSISGNIMYHDKSYYAGFWIGSYNIEIVLDYYVYGTSRISVYETKILTGIKIFGIEGNRKILDTYIHHDLDNIDPKIVEYIQDCVYLYKDHTKYLNLYNKLDSSMKVLNKSKQIKWVDIVNKKLKS